MTEYTGGPPVEVITSEILVTVVTPEMTPDWRIWALPLVRTNYELDLWAVIRYHQYLGTDGTWSWRNSEDDEWRASHFLPLEEAQALAAKHAPRLKIGRETADQVAGRYYADKLAELGEEMQPSGS